MVASAQPDTNFARERPPRYRAGSTKSTEGAFILKTQTLNIAAALIYDRALSEPERLDVETYLQTTYIDSDFLLA